MICCLKAGDPRLLMVEIPAQGWKTQLNGEAQKERERERERESRFSLLSPVCSIQALRDCMGLTHIGVGGLLHLLIQC